MLARAVPDEPVTITLSRHGWIRSRQGHGLDATQFTYKAGDGPLAVLETRTVHPIVDPRHARPRLHDPRVRRSGRARRRRSGDHADRASRPAPRSRRRSSGDPEHKYLVAGSGGYGFIASFEDMVSRVKAGKTFMTLDADEAPLAPGAAGRRASITSRR